MKCSLLTLSAYVDEELDPPHRGELEAHLVGCDRCRGGVDWLRDEADHVGALARVHLPDHSVHALFEQLGLVGPTDPLPPRTLHEAPRRMPSDMEPWMSPDQSGALPWRVPRPQPGVTVIPPPEDAIELTGTAAMSFREAPSPPGGDPLAGGDDDRPSARVHEDAPLIQEPLPYSRDPAATGRTSMDQPPLEEAVPRFSDEQPPGGTSVATYPSLPEAPPVPADYSDDQAPAYDAPPPLPEPLRADGPVPAPASPFTKLRGRLALRRALARGGDRAFDDSVQVFSGRGAPLGSARSRVRSEREARHQQSWSDAPEATVTLPERRPPYADVRATDLEPEREAPPPLSQRVAALRERIDARRRIRSTLGSAIVAPGRAERTSGAAVDRRPLAIFAGGAVVLMVIGILSGRSVTPLPPAPAQALQQQQPVAVQPQSQSQSPSNKNPVQPTPTGQALGTTLTNAEVVGSGGHGYSVSGIRYGIHPGDFRIVFDFRAGPGATGTPTATIGTVNGVLQVQLAGVSASPNLGQLPNSNPVTNVAVANPSPVQGAAVYNFTLSRAVTVSAYYVNGPLRLVIDVH